METNRCKVKNAPIDSYRWLLFTISTPEMALTPKKRPIGVSQGRQPSIVPDILQGSAWFG